MTLLRYFILIVFCTCGTSMVNAADSKPSGKIVGGKAHSLPGWFKQSFLDIAEDVDEASAEGKHVMLFFDLNACPYCDRMLEESFKEDPVSSYIQSNFDVISVNIQGDLEIAFNEEIVVTERKLAEILKVYATPTLVFLDEKNETVVRVHGYRAPERFQQELEFVATRSYRSAQLADYLQAKLDRDVYKLRDNQLFTEATDLSSIKGSVMLVFEDGSCYDCDEFHDGILTDERVQPEIERFTIVRLDADSKETIVDFNGNDTTPAELALKHEMIYRPGVLLFDGGKLLRRHDSLLYPHHMMESLGYVGGGYHKKIDYRSYTTRLREELLQSGGTIDWARTPVKK